jgi:RNA polymerase sigma-70 factor, ECF subfamily
VTPDEKLNRFEEQISPHIESAYNLANWLLRNHDDAEDVVQEALLRAFLALDNLRSDDAKPWLLRIVRNACLTRLKRDQTSAHLVELNEFSARPVSVDPEAALLISSDRDLVRRILEQLPPDFREVIVLRELEGLSYKEIAAIAGVRMGTIMSRLSRARDHLKKLLSTRGKDQG